MKILHEDPSRYSARNMVKPVHFYCEAPKAHAVSLVGDFNEWNPATNVMSRRIDGWWAVEVELPHGHHRYRFLVDGNPVRDPRANGSEHDENGQGVSLIAVS